ncbi:ABC transporter ATP-binding protein/permease [Actinocorallia sp. API 0066]|nr:ABC transporter ATP-binding protein/permease [Actinocorallia sp. API 0066]
MLLPVAEPRRVRAAVVELAGEHRGAAWGGVAVLVGATVVGLLAAPVLGRIIDLVAAGEPAGAVTGPVVALVVIALVQAAATAVGVSLVARAGEGMLALLRERFVERALALPLARVEKAGSGDLTSRVTGDVTVVTEVVREAVPALIRAVLTIVLTLAALAVLDWRFLIVALVAVPLQIVTLRWYTRRAAPLYAAQRVASGALQQQMLGTVGGAPTVRAFGLADRHVGLVADRSHASVDLALRGVRLVTTFFSRLNVAEFAGLTAVLVTAYFLVGRDAISIGTASAAALYFHSLFTPVNVALGLADDAQTATAGLARLVGVADLETGDEARPEPSDEPVIRVREASYAYRPDRPVLHGVDLDVAPGERVALVGSSGAGKTTLARLVAGVHPPGGGAVTVGGPSALVSQEVHVFAGPLAEDLRLARPNADEDALWAALEQVGADGWARALPEGLDTVVGDDAHRLTAAQAQQLALARLVLADPRVVVLDEATAEAGSSGARALEASADAAVRGRTSLVVAHRLTQAASADRVVVLDEGRVVETGTHDDLLRQGGRYAALWRAWSDHRP